jgi:uncharacterized Fe-S center protein
LAATVFFTDLSAGFKRSLPSKVSNLFAKLEPEKVIRKRDLVAIKIHFGEAGGTAFIRPQLVRKVVDRLLELKSKPFLTDTNTLYVGSRAESYSHLVTAFENGFTREVTGAPVMISDGLRGSNSIGVAVDGTHIKQAHIAADIHNADALIVLTHFKGHELSGFGGTLKNLGMGCASREGKLDQHSDISPKVKEKLCIGCGDCISWCRGGAISLKGEGKQKKSLINPENCVGCAECILTCPQGAIQIQWNTSVPVFLEKMVEYTAGVLKNKQEKALFLSFVTDVSPACDCYPFSDRPIVPSLGILASSDPVAIDQAAADLVNRAPGNPIPGQQNAFQEGEDKFLTLYPQVDWTHQLAYAESIGIGTREYTLVNLDENAYVLE